MKAITFIGKQQYDNENIMPSLRTILLFSIFSSLFFNNLLAGGTIKGTVYAEDNSQIPFVSVILFNSGDTSKIEYGTISDLQGDFILSNVKSRLYYLSFSCVGYKTSYQRIDYNGLDTSIIVTLEIEKHLLGEVTITATENVFNSNEKKSYVFSKEDRKQATSSFDLVSLLPKIQVNPVEKTISSIHGEVIRILINGQNAESYDLQLLKPTDIIRIEHFDVVPARFASLGVTGVINVITRKSQEGTELFLDVQNALFTGFGNDLINIKYNHRNSQISLLYYINYRKYKKRAIDNYLEYSLDGRLYVKSRNGLESPFAYTNQFIRLEYNFQKNENFSIGFRITPNFYKSSRHNNQDVFIDSLVGQSKAFDDYFEIRPEVNFFLNKNFRGNQKLVFDITATYFDNNYYDKRYESLFGGDTAYFNLIETTGNRFSIITEGIYSKTFKLLNFTSGIRHAYSTTNQKINSSLVNTNSIISSSDYYGYAEVLFRKEKYSISTSIGLSMFQYYDETLFIKHNFISFRPNIVFNYKINDYNDIRLNYYIEPIKPAISDLSISKYYFDENLVFAGNPNLKPFNSHNIDFKYSHVLKKINFEIGTIDYFANNPILYNYEQEENYIVRTNRNEKQIINYSVYSSLSYSAFKKNWLKFNAYFEAYKQTNSYLHIGGFTMKGKLINLDIIGYYQNFSFSYSFNSGNRSLKSIDIIKSEQSSIASLKYKKDRFSFSLGIYYPFAKSWYSGINTVEKSIVKRIDNCNIYENGNMIYFNITYRVSTGLKKDTDAKQIYNRDNDSGVLRTE